MLRNTKDMLHCSCLASVCSFSASILKASRVSLRGLNTDRPRRIHGRGSGGPDPGFNEAKSGPRMCRQHRPKLPNNFAVRQTSLLRSDILSIKMKKTMD